ncbi:hypothetical protein FHG87_007261 [Trinorchestia longiramus]|nr:hypothetical protein FHG87_007261 [Trinorchestia longiramus]
MGTEVLLLVFVGLVVAEELPNHNNNNSHEFKADEIAEIGNDFLPELHIFPESQTSAERQDHRTQAESGQEKIADDTNRGKLTSDSSEFGPDDHSTHGSGEHRQTSHHQHGSQNKSPVHHIMGRKGVSMFQKLRRGSLNLRQTGSSPAQVPTSVENEESSSDASKSEGTDEESISHELDSKEDHTEDESSYAHSGIEYYRHPHFGHDNHRQDHIDHEDDQDFHGKLHHHYHLIIPEDRVGDFMGFRSLYGIGEAMFNYDPFISSSEEDGRNKGHEFTHEHSRSCVHSNSEDDSSEAHSREWLGQGLKFRHGDVSDDNSEIICREYAPHNQGMKCYACSRQVHHPDDHNDPYGASHGHRVRNLYGHSAFTKTKSHHSRRSSHGSSESQAEESPECKESSEGSWPKAHKEQPRVKHFQYQLHPLHQPEDLWRQNPTHDHCLRSGKPIYFEKRSYISDLDPNSSEEGLLHADRIHLHKSYY